MKAAPAIPPGTRTWSAARELLAAYAKDFFKHWSKTAKGYQVEEIHDMRVASRRLREGLALFEACFPSGALSRIGKKVKTVTEILGDLRNTDEAILFFGGLTADEGAACRADLDQLLEHLRTEALAARRQLKTDLEVLKPAPLKKAIRTALGAPLLFGNLRTDPFQPLSGFADAAIRDRALPIAEILPEAREEANAASQHRLRIAVKRLRYRLEILQPLFGTGFEELHAALKGYQEVLGKLHDLDVFSAQVLDRVPAGAAQQHLVRVITVRRSALFESFIGMLEGAPVDAIGAKARSLL